MAGLELVAVLCFLSFFGLIVYLMVRSERKAKVSKLQISQSLGFTPIDPDPDLLRKMNHLNENIRANLKIPADGKFELQNVSRKRLADGEMFIFDLINTSGDSDSYSEKRAVAIISPSLNLPHFMIFPRAVIDGSIADLANKFLDWLMAKVGNPVEFPEYPDFEGRYLVSSLDPEATRLFLDSSKLRRLANTKHYGIHAGGDMFTLSSLHMSTGTLSLEMMSERVSQAMGVFNIFTS
jgi:hypothetical protein